MKKLILALSGLALMAGFFITPVVVMAAEPGAACIATPLERTVRVESTSGGPAPGKGPARMSGDHGRKTITNSIGMKFVLIPAGSFIMGSPPGELKRNQDEHQHRVTISRPFYLQTTEVTQDQWVAVMGKNPSWFKGRGDRPVENVSYQQAREFIDRLNRREKTTRYRLPTEAEWEFACRAGTTTVYSCGDSPGCLSGCAWCSSNSGGKTHPVGKKPPNRWGLFDMHGNVWEWCSDRYNEDYYKKSPPSDPKGPAMGGDRVFRGGAWAGGPSQLRSARRNDGGPSCRLSYLGFRVARDY
jgi:formylglycine-generating enzyme required for sulfatase activity